MRLASPWMPENPAIEKHARRRNTPPSLTDTYLIFHDFDFKKEFAESMNESMNALKFQGFQGNLSVTCHVVNAPMNEPNSRARAYVMDGCECGWMWMWWMDVTSPARKHAFALNELCVNSFRHESLRQVHPPRG